jgi:hypothetical protein
MMQNRVLVRRAILSHIVHVYLRPRTRVDGRRRRINDAKRCSNMDCRVRLMCDRVVLRKAVES